MSTHKQFDKICCVVLALTLLVSVLFVNAEKLGVQKASTVMGYETAIFDNSKVHTIDIVMDNWDEFLESCRSEEYYNCSVVIDNEAYKNVAIRGKGNTSLSSVDSYGNNRYSFKIEFDHYDNTNTYHGLDKLVLNNIIQDNTYMKDYLTYQMMGKMGVAAPLCSYVYITVNGEDWGLYLAVEGVEESFLQRNYGKDYGELYKPDSMSMGGGRGNGKDFDIDAFMGSEDSGNEITAAAPTQPDANKGETTTNAPDEEESATTPSSAEDETNGNTTTAAPDSFDMPGGMTPPEGGGNPFGGEMPEGFTFPEGENPFGGEMPDFGEMPEGMTPPDMGGNFFGGQMPDGMTPPDMSGENSGVSEISTDSSASSMIAQLTESSSSARSERNGASGFEMPSMGDMGGFNFNIDEESVRKAFEKLGIDESLLDGIDFENISMTDIMSLMTKLDEDTVEKLMQEIMGNGASGMPSFGGDKGGNFGGFGGMGSSDVKLQYIDDNAESYQNIFGNAKTDITNADETRLIEALRKLSNGEDLENTVDVEAVIRYFVVHNFVVNSDSYTGSMIHNYYLYEKDGQMQMIPWDYNLAFGSFMSMGSATSSVNDPIDTPLSVSRNGDRPMIDWIFSNEEYTALYHQYFSEFVSEYFDSGYFESFINSTIDIISPYVEKDPTKFCTYEEFQKGSTTLKEFCVLRAESVKGQLNGTIGATSTTQISDTLIDASDLSTSDMGSMGSMGGKGGMDFHGGDMQKPQSSADKNSNAEGAPEKPPSDSDATENSGGSNNSRPQMPGGFSGSTMPGFSSSGNAQQNGQTQNSDGNTRPDSNQSQFRPQSTVSVSSLAMLGVSILLLGFGLIFALRYKRRK